MKTKVFAASAVAAAGILAFSNVMAAKVIRTTSSDGSATVSVGQVIFPSGAAGTHGSGVEQVDQVVQILNRRLAERGLSIGSLIHHTLYVKAGKVNTMKILQRFHGDAHKLAPELKQDSSVGTIIQVPGFKNPDTLVMVDIIAAAPKLWGQPDNFSHIHFVYGPQAISESIRVGNLVYTSGMEGMDFQHRKLASTVDGQVQTVARKYHDTLMRAGLGMANLVSQDLFINKSANAEHVIKEFDRLAKKNYPDLETMGARMVVIVDGMVSPAFQVESDAIAATGNPADFENVPFQGSKRTTISKSVSDGDLVFLSALGGANLKTGEAPRSIDAQIEATVQNVSDTLAQSGLNYGDVVKQRLFIKKGTNVKKALAAYHEATQELAPKLKSQPAAESVVVVEGFPNEALKFMTSIIAAHPVSQ